MLTRSVVLATTLTVGLVAGVGSSAIAVALIPGDASGSTQLVEAIASPMQDPAEGSSGWFVESTPVTLSIARPVVIDGGGDQPVAKVDAATEQTPVATPSPSPSASDTGAPNSGGSGNGGSGNGAPTTPSTSGSTVDDKAKEDKVKEDKVKKDQKDKTKKDKKDEAKKEDKAKEDKAKEDKAKEDKGEKDEDQSDGAESDD